LTGFSKTNNFQRVRDFFAQKEEENTFSKKFNFYHQSTRWRLKDGSKYGSESH
jgi:hypothetical protein